MIATPLQYPLISPLQTSHSGIFLSSSRHSSVDADPLRLSVIDDPLKPRVPIQDLQYDQDIFSKPSSLNLKPLPCPRQLSESASQPSELFKTAVPIDQQSRSDSSLHATLMTSSNSPPSTPHPINLSHLSGERFPSRMIAPLFPLIPTPPSECPHNTKGHLHCKNFSQNHRLNIQFVELYQLGDELGAGGYGFVMTARHRLTRREVAVKFIIKDKVPEHGWIEDELLGRLPSEVVLLRSINHEGVVEFIDLFEDDVYFYLVQELHGAPWQPCHGPQESDSMTSTPTLSPSTSETSLDSPEPTTPPPLSNNTINSGGYTGESSDYFQPFHPSPFAPVPPKMTRRASYDLFECIEQTVDKRFCEVKSHRIFTQIVDIVHHLDELGISHRDIKDENLVVDQNLKVKLIDFGSACIADKTKPRPYYTQFFGTAAYASTEILLRKKYQAAPVEVWTLGVLLSFLLTGVSPFPSVRDAIMGRVVVSKAPGVKLSEEVMDLMRRCLDTRPERRITIQQIKEHPWIVSPPWSHL